MTLEVNHATDLQSIPALVRPECLEMVLGQLKGLEDRIPFTLAIEPALLAETVPEREQVLAVA